MFNYILLCFILNDPEIEAVVVETEEKYLTKYATMVAEHKKHMHMEKPGGTELLDFENFVKIVKDNKTVFHLGYMYRYNPYVIELKEKIKNGELGEIISVEAQMNCTHNDDIRKWLANFPGGMFFFTVSISLSKSESLTPPGFSICICFLWSAAIWAYFVKYISSVSTETASISGFSRISASESSL